MKESMRRNKCDLLRISRHSFLLSLSLIRFQKQSTEGLFQGCKHKNKHTHDPHPASTSLFPKGSKRNQLSSRGVLCKQAKGISTWGKKQQTRMKYGTKTIFDRVTACYTVLTFPRKSFFPTMSQSQTSTVIVPSSLSSSGSNSSSKVSPQ